MAYKPEYYYRQSAVIPYLWNKGQVKVMLITTQKKKKWTLPKGIIEPGLSPPRSAAREAYEEAGVLGEVDEELFDHFEYDKWGGTCHVQVFLMEITELLDQWPEQYQRSRKLVDACMAPQLIGRESIRPVLRRFCKINARSS
ncbi:MAG: NUDIX hydrolase [Bacteroidales bacterium]|nr:NUDIX hydrolase [Bacteroidales bacterium]